MLLLLTGCRAQKPDLLAYQTQPLTLALHYTCGESLREGILSLDGAGGASLQFTQPATLAGLTISRTDRGYALSYADGSSLALDAAGNLPDLAVLEGLFSLTNEQMISSESNGTDRSTAVYQTDFGPVSLHFNGDSPLPTTIEAPEIGFTVTIPAKEAP